MNAMPAMTDAELIRLMGRAMALAKADLERCGVVYGDQTNFMKALEAYARWLSKRAFGS